MIAFTICSSKEFAYALTLHETFSRHHPDSEFYVARSDGREGLDAASLPFRVLGVPELGLPDPEGMAARLGDIEFRAAIRPFVFQVLFDRLPGSSVLFLDPMVFVTSSFDELRDLLAGGAECVLTPAITEPAEHAQIDDRLILRYGAYDLGFCCLTDTPSVRRVVWWWARRLETAHPVDPDAGPFIHQRWADLFPAFIERTQILRHPGYNVSYWNLPQRRIRRIDGGWSVNGEPLRFFNFSRADVEDETVFSPLDTSPDVRRAGPATALLTEFHGVLMRHGQDLRLR